MTQISGRKKPATRKDVARAAGVSLTTVTHALNNKPGTRVNEETRERVKSIARQMGYRPNFVGRALVTGKSFCVGLLRPELQSLFLTFYQYMTFGMAKAMSEDDYNLLLLFRDEKKNYMKTINQGRIDGMIIQQSDFDDEHINRIIDTQVPVVILNRTFECKPETATGCVASDHRLLMEQVFGDFVARGCRNIVSIHNYMSCDPNNQMFKAYTELGEQYIQQGINATSLIPSENNFRSQISNMLKCGQRWDGVFLDGVELAKTFIKEAAANGLMLGKDYRLTLCDNEKDIIPETFTDPVSIYVQQPKEMGRAAWLLLRKLINQEETKQKVLIPYAKFR
jgi:LacI family transcriptional regulator